MKMPKRCKSLESLNWELKDSFSRIGIEGWEKATDLGLTVSQKKTRNSGQRKKI